MDMKKILQAFDGVAERKVEGANDMRKFLSIVAKEPVKQNLSESVITSFDEDTIGGDANSFLIAADDINDLVMGNLDKIKINADEQLLKTVMSKFNEFMSAYHAVGKEILQPDMFDDVQVEEKQEGISNGLAFKDYFALEEGKNKIKGVAEGGASMPGDQYLSIPADQTKLSIGQQMARDGITYSPDKEDELIGLMSQYMKKAGMSSTQIRYYLSYDEDFISDQLSDLPKQGSSKGVAEEKQKGVDGKACWDGYKRMGTKKKGGKTVDNCVPTGKK
jgi:hypothetical protein